jgi:hypothetical protein
VVVVVFEAATGAITGGVVVSYSFVLVVSVT